MKASPLLRAWLRRLEVLGVELRVRHRWTGFTEDGYVFATPQGSKIVRCDGVLLALGGASWPRLGSDATWMPWLRAKGVGIVDFRAANCGFDVDWSAPFRERFAGAPLKSVMATSDAGSFPGEMVMTQHGIEGSLVYAHSAALRDRIQEEGAATLTLDLMPGRTENRLSKDFARQTAKASLSTRLRKGAGIEGVKAAILRELAGPGDLHDPEQLARLIKALPVPVVRPRPIAEAISSAGGIGWGSVDSSYMLNALPGVFVAGEMLDWEAPTGGYLLTACLATGRAAALGLNAWLNR
jgi:uncharacterized flavoprotein (TIGR03862 family)